ncbi:MAG: FAD-dependent oxidoreductase [Bacillota bacterium]|nr:FAD-dependent oxidoreductase [Bacillota bacterium]
MNRVYEKEKYLPVLAKTDVLVVGGGPAGMAAAIASAREGADTILLERYGFFGGNLTQAMVESLVWYRHEQTVEAGGIGRELEEYATAFGGTYPDPESTGRLLDADMFKCAADKLVEKEGVRPLFHCYGVGAIVDNGLIKGVITESKSGRQAVLAKTVIDASGDADIAAFAGAPYRQEPTGKLMDVTTGFGVSGVDEGVFRKHIAEQPGKIGDWSSLTDKGEEKLFSAYFSSVFEKARKDGIIPEDSPLEGFWHAITEAGEVTGINVTRISNVDPTNVWDLTMAEIEGRKQVLQALEALRLYQPGFEKAKLRSIGSSIGTRESRKISGRYYLTEYDVRNQARFEDTIGIFPEFLDAYGIVIIPTTGRYFQVPYGVMVPEKVDNLLVAGRSVAGDRVSHSATRQMMCCAVTGQGAGVAAAVAINSGRTTASVDISEVQKRLLKQGVRIK